MPLRVVSAVDSVVSVVSFVVAAVVVTVVSDSSVALSHAHKSTLPVQSTAKSSEVILLAFFLIEFSPFYKTNLIPRCRREYRHQKYFITRQLPVKYTTITIRMSRGIKTQTGCLKTQKGSFCRTLSIVCAKYSYFQFTRGRPQVYLHLREASACPIHNPGCSRIRWTLRS